MKNLQSEFANGEINHFTYYDYILQACLNGVWSSLKETLTELENDSLLTLLINNQDELRTTGVNSLRAEILNRMKNNV